MPARRRRTLSRSPSQRFTMWDKKVKGDIYQIYLDSVKPIVRDKVAFYQSVHEYLIKIVRGIISRFGVDNQLIHEYMWYAEKLWSFTQKYSMKALQFQADALYLWYLARGRNDAILRAIARALGIKISSLEDIIERVGVVTLLRKVAEGTILTDGSEQTVFEYTGLGVIQGYIDLQNMADGDEVIIRVYTKIKADGEYKKYASDRFIGVQEEPALYILPRLSVYAFKVTIQQVAGTPKSFDYVFVRGS